MGNITVEVKDTGVREALRLLSRRLRNMTPIMQGIQAEMIADIQAHFRKNQGSTSAWPELSESTVNARRKGKRKSSSIMMLRDTGLLRNSLISGPINSTPKSGIRIIYKNKAIVGTTVEYASVHNQGEGNVPQREFMWLSEKANKNIIKMVADAIEKEWKKYRDIIKW